MGYFPTGYLPTGYLAPGYFPGVAGDTPPPATLYDDLYKQIGIALGKSSIFWTPTPNTLMVQLVARELPIALRKVPCMSGGTYDYSSLSGSKKTNFDTGFVEIVADMLRNRLNLNANDGRGQVVEEHAGSVSEKFASASNTSISQTESDKASRELGWPSWRNEDCVAASLRASAGAFRAFGTVSRSRAHGGCCGGGSGGCY